MTETNSNNQHSHKNPDFEKALGALRDVTVAVGAVMKELAAKLKEKNIDFDLLSHSSMAHYDDLWKMPYAAGEFGIVFSNSMLFLGHASVLDGGLTTDVEISHEKVDELILLLLQYRAWTHRQD